MSVWAKRATLAMLFGVAIFGVMATLVTEGRIEEEIAMLRLLEEQRSQGWTSVMVAVTRFGSGPVTAALTTTLCIWLFARSWRLEAAFLALSNLGSAALNTGLKAIFERQRPQSEIVSAITDPQSFSFPSGHALSAMVFYVSILIVGARLAGAPLRASLLTLAVIMVPMMGFTRLYLGVHYPTDVIAGWAVGAAWVSSSYLAFFARRDTDVTTRP